MSKLSEKLAAVKEAEESEEATNTQQTLHAGFVARTHDLLDELARLSEIAVPGSLEDFDQEVAEEFVGTLHATVDFLKGEGDFAPVPKKEKTPKERKPLKLPNFKKLGASLKAGIDRLP